MRNDLSAAKYLVTAHWIDALHAIGWTEGTETVNAAVRAVIWAVDAWELNAKLTELGTLLEGDADPLPGLHPHVVQFRAAVRQARRQAPAI